MTSDWLSAALEESRSRGFLGPGPLEPQIRHAKGFAAAWDIHENSPPPSLLDLGSGGGLPGLVLAEAWGCPTVLLDSMIKRTSFLEEALGWPGAPPATRVELGRAEDLARRSDLEGAYALVVVRSFGPPAVVAECAVRFLQEGGLIIVSEPPNGGSPTRWNPEGLAALGLEDCGLVTAEFGYRVVRRIGPLDDRYPRRVGVPGSRPLF